MSAIANNRSAVQILSKLPILPTGGLWYDASVYSSITKDGSNLVAEWSDQSGSSKPMTQSTGNLKPTYISNGFNGLPCLRFAESGSANFLVASSFNPGSNPTLFCVLRNRTKPVANATIIAGYNSDRGFTLSSYGTLGFNFLNSTNSGGSSALYHPVPLMTCTVVMIQFGNSGTTTSIWRCSNSPEILFRHSGDVGIANDIYLGVNPYESSARANVDLAELVVYPSAISLTETQRDAIYKHLLRKWRIT